jgi:hypothetical protein
MVHQTDQFPQSRLAPQVDYPVQFGVVMPVLPHLNKLNFPSKTIYDLLIATGLPPFDCQIISPSRCDNPKRSVLAGCFVDLGIPGLLLLRKMNVALKRGRLYVKFQAVIEELDKTVKAMIGNLIALINEGISTLNFFRLRIVIG